MADTWRDHWDRLLALQERIEQHATGRSGTPIEADADFASFLVESENLRDGVKKECERRSLASYPVDAQMRSVISLQLAHDLAIKVKHEIQTREKPWSTASDATYRVKVSKSLPEPHSPFGSRGRSTTVPGTLSPPLEPRRWAHEWEIRYTPHGLSTLIVDGLQFSRGVIADWRTILTTQALA